MEVFTNAFARGWELFWSFWPKNFWLLIAIASITEVLTVIAFRLGGNRGWMAFLGYFLGFLTLAFYAEAQKYSSVSIAYFAWLIGSTSLIGLSAFLIFRENFSWTWILGFILAILGLFVMQSVVSDS